MEKSDMIKQAVDMGNIPCAIAIFKAENLGLVYANDAYKNIFDANNCEYLNILPEDADKLRHHLKASAPTVLEYRFIDKNGRLKCAYMMTEKMGDGYVSAAMFADTAIDGVYRVYKEALSNDKILVMEINVDDDTCRIIKNGIGTVVYTTDFSKNISNTVFENQKDVQYIMDDSETEPYALKLRCGDDDEWNWYILYKNIVCGENGRYIYATLCNIDNQKQTEENLRSKIKIDPLTKVYSREAGKEKIENELILGRNRADYALFVLDIDNFKMINDTFGHLYGDAMLSMAAGCIKSAVDEDDIVGRFGGDEFFVFVRKADFDTIMAKADRINKSVLSMRANISDDNDIACSIGIALGSETENTYQELFEKADIALYKAKNEGKNRVVIYNDDMKGETGGSLCYDRDDDNENKTQSHDLTRVALEIAARSTSFQNAVHMIMRHIGLSLDVDDVKIMRVRYEDDRVSIEHHWSKVKNVAERDNRTGYYLHQDIDNLRRLFEKEPLFVVSEASKDGFSPKFVHELDKLNNKSVIYSSSLTRDKSFFYLVLSCFTPDRQWSTETRKMIGDLTKVLVVYLQKNLTEVVFPDDDPMTVEPHTKLLYYDKFMEQSGLVRKLAQENGERSVLIYADFSNAYLFKREYGSHNIDRVFVNYAASINRLVRDNRNKYISCHIYGTTQYISLIRCKNTVDEVKAHILEFNRDFCTVQKETYPDFDFVINAAIGEVKPNVQMDIVLDDLRIKARQNPYPAECTCYVLE